MSKETPRPCVIVQKDNFNSRSPNTIVVPVTHSQATMSCLIPIKTKVTEAGEAVLDGKVNVSNIICISKARLKDYICKLDNMEMKEIDQALVKQIDIFQYYSDIKKQQEKDKLYIKKIKEQRNNSSIAR